MKEFKETEERDAFLARELEDLDKAKKELLALIADLDVRIDYEFKSGNQINPGILHIRQIFAVGSR
jgi:chromosome segregation ATPase